MVTSKFAIMGMVICTLITAAGQIFLKLAADNFSPDLSLVFKNYYLMAALILYAIGLVIMTLCYKYGELSVLYPIISLSFIWVSLLSFFWLGESLNAFKIGGVVLTVLGVSFVGKGANGSTKRNTNRSRKR